MNKNYKINGSKKNNYIIYSVDSFSNGIAFGTHKSEGTQDPRYVFSLRLDSEPQPMKLRSRYILHQNNPFHELENHLMRLSKRGVLHEAIIRFGVTTDPFYPFEGKFDVTMKFLDIFRRYTPGLLSVQTRSPLIVLAMPVLQKLGVNASVTMAVETICEESVKKYTPEAPRASDRLDAAVTLRRFNIPVTIQVNPILPYGEWKADAKTFAKAIVNASDNICVGSLTDGSDAMEKRLRGSPLAKKLAKDRKFHWLRPDSGVPLISAIEEIAPEKLLIPARTMFGSKQLEIFAA